MKTLLFFPLLIGCCSVSAQNIGIGTTTPAFKLDVRNGNINTDSAYLIRGRTVVRTSGDGTFIGHTMVGTALPNNENTSVGYEALRSNGSGVKNTAMGAYALFDNTTGIRNTACGTYALTHNQDGIRNCAFGQNSLLFNYTGSFNTAVGSDALNGNITGSRNTAVGVQAGYVTSAAEFNTVVGYLAANTYDMGWNNTIVGADADVSFNGQYNSIAIGNIARATDNSKVRIGNSANWSYEAFANWTNISDGRCKKNIAETVKGLPFILKLRPVNYQIDMTALSRKLDEEHSEDEFMKTALAEKEQMIWTGFVAQEVEAAAVETGFQFSGVDKPRNEHGVYGLRYAEFVVPLVKAVQEQQVMIAEMKKEIELLKEQNKLLLQVTKK